MDKTALEKLVLKRRAQGVSQSSIAREVGLTRQRIWQVCKGLGLPRVQRRPREDRVRLLPGLMQQGLTNTQIADRLGVSHGCVVRDLRSLPKYQKLLATRAAAKPAAVRRGKIPGLLEQGMSRRQIADSLGVDLPTIQRDMRRMQIPKRYMDMAAANRRSSDPRLKPVVQRRSRVQVLRKQGRPVIEIARELEVPGATVWNDLLRMR